SETTDVGGELCPDSGADSCATSLAVRSAAPIAPEKSIELGTSDAHPAPDARSRQAACDHEPLRSASPGPEQRVDLAKTELLDALGRAPDMLAWPSAIDQPRRLRGQESQGRCDLLTGIERPFAPGAVNERPRGILVAA